MYHFAIQRTGLNLLLKDLSDPSTEFTNSWKVSSSEDTFVGDTNPWEVTLSPNTWYDVSLLSSTGEVLRTIQLNTTDSEIFLFEPIDRVAETLLPGYSFDWEKFESLKRKWQITVGPAAGVEDSKIYDETVYPQPANTLIAFLIVRDLIIYKYNQLLMDSGEGSGSPTRVITGPTEVDFNGIDKTLSALMQEGRPFKVFMEQLCSLARLYNLHFMGCKEDNSLLKVFYVGDLSYDYRYVKAPPYGS